MQNVSFHANILFSDCILDGYRVAPKWYLLAIFDQLQKYWVHHRSKEVHHNRIVLQENLRSSRRKAETKRRNGREV